MKGKYDYLIVSIEIVLSFASEIYYIDAENFDNKKWKPEAMYYDSCKRHYS